jgi:LacI family transcriptional regulator
MATIKDVAKVANTSPATVSRFLNGGRVKKRTETAILEAIQDLDYHVHTLARGLKTKKSYTVGYVVPDLTNMFFSRVAKGAGEIFYQRGYSFMVLSTDNNEAREAEISHFLLERKVDGVLLSSVSKSTSHIEHLLQNGIPVVLIDRMLPNLEVDSVLVDNINGVYAAIEILIKNGHRKIGIICGPQNIYTGRERYFGYLRAMEDYGQAVDPELVKFGDFEIETGYTNMMELLNQETRPTAVFVSNNYMSVGAVIALNEKNIKIPEDLSFFTFDDMELARVYNPSITAVVQPMVEIGETASRTLLERMNTGGKEKVIHRLKTGVVLRDSVRSLQTVHLAASPRK